MNLVPCYCFGETDLYEHSRLLLPLRQWIARRFGIALTLAWGPMPLVAPWRPFPVPLVQVVGKPLLVERAENPTSEQVDDLHRRYVTALRQLFDDHKVACGYPKAILKIL